TIGVRGLPSWKARRAEHERAARAAVGLLAPLEADARRLEPAPLGVAPVHEHVDVRVAAQELRKHRDERRVLPAHDERGAAPPVLSRGAGRADSVADDGALDG